MVSSSCRVLVLYVAGEIYLFLFRSLFIWICELFKLVCPIRVVTCVSFERKFFTLVKYIFLRLDHLDPFVRVCNFL